MKYTGTTRPKPNSKKLFIVGSLVALSLLGVGAYYFFSKGVFLGNASDIISHHHTAADIKEPVYTDTQQPVDTQYLVLDNWNVKFKIPSGLEGINYYYNSEHGSYSFTTERVEALGGQCKEPPEYAVPGVIRLITIVRDKRPAEIGGPTGLVGVPLNNNEKLGDYYFRYYGAQSMCSDKQDGDEVQKTDQELLRSMVVAIELN